ncbi:MAG: alpha/beta hydrolase family esterase [Candidatus Dormibacteria bacterium]
MTSEGELVAGELKAGGRRRSFTIRRPRAAPEDRPMPLVLVLHGNGPTACGQMIRDWTTFDDQSDAWGFAIAYPDGQGGSWADGRGVTRADAAGVDDVEFLRAVIDWSAHRCGTAPDRTVASGMSNGAFMAHRLALEASDQVAVLAAVLGGLPMNLDDVEPTHAVSAMLIHGTADMITPIGRGFSRHRGPGGRRRGGTLSLEETADRWRAVNRCPSGADETRTTEFSSHTRTTGGVGGTQVVAWTVFGGGHNWPGAPVTPEWDEPTTQEFDGAEEICRFADALLAPAADRRL